jgi:predicted RNA polymerase sigma factor
MVPSLGGEHWADRMDRLGRAIWELFHAHPEIGYLRAEVYLADDDSSPEVLATDVAGGVLWVDDQDASNNRQVILPDGGFARNTP